MTKRRKTSWRRPAGTTLVETAAGLVVLGTILVSILLARAEMEKQDRRSRDRLSACAVLDALLEGWRLQPETAPSGGLDEGPVPDREGWRWRARALQRDDAEALNADVLAVEVLAPGSSGDETVAKIEVLRPRVDTGDANAPAH
jgi:hypothetical protein